ncbi:hypothetical protein [Microbacterium sp.]|uniref:hypothetical protein n=1 Tax=Microbacterium sp. TaxID=51671 RepID=UPI003221D657
MDAFPQPSAIGRGPSDAELDAFHGGGATCVITVTSDGKVTTSGDCSNVTIKDR